MGIEEDGNAYGVFLLNSNAMGKFDTHFLYPVVDVFFLLQLCKTNIPCLEFVTIV